MNIGLLPARNARYRPNHLAVVFKDQRLDVFRIQQASQSLGECVSEDGREEG